MAQLAFHPSMYVFHSWARISTTAATIAARRASSCVNVSTAPSSVWFFVPLSVSSSHQRLDLTVDHLYACGVKTARPRLLELLQLSHPRLGRCVFATPSASSFCSSAGSSTLLSAEHWSPTNFVGMACISCINIPSSSVMWTSSFSSTLGSDGSAL